MVEGTGISATGDDAVAQVEAQVGEWADKGLAKYLENAALAGELVEWVHEETQIPKGVLRLAVKLAAPLVAAAAKAGGGWLGKVAKQHLVEHLSRMPLYPDIAAALNDRIARLDKEFAAKQEVQDILAGRRRAADAEFTESLALDLRAQVKALQGLDELDQAVRDGFAHLEARLQDLLNRQPPLHIHLLDQTEETRFVFRSRSVPFVGREDAWQALDWFLDGDEGFAWWLVSGAAGSGKSRLALEFCLAKRTVWHAGFLPEDMGKGSAFGDWHTWQPDQPTLIVADYASAPERAEALRDIALTLAGRAKEGSLDGRVRLLLLEREAAGRWLDDFLGAGSDRHVIEQSRHAEPLALGPLDDRDLLDVARTFARKTGGASADEARILEDLKRIDTGGRPLFAAFLGDAAESGEGPRAWDREALVRDVLDRERVKRWEPAGVTEQEEYVLALATMTGGLTEDQFHTLAGVAPFEDLSAFSAGRYATMSGRPDPEVLSPLEPDIVGELFVLRRLEPAPFAPPPPVDALRQAAWDLSPVGMAFFLARTAMDFPGHATLRHLAAPADASPETRVLWSLTTFDMVTHLGKAGEVAAARDLYDTLADLAQRHPGEPELRLRQARAVYNLVTLCGKAGDIPAARHLYDTLADLAQRHTGEPELRLRQAQAAFNLVSDYRTAGDIPAARHLYDTLADLAQRHPGEPELRLRQARAAVNLVSDYGTAGDIPAARHLYDTLADLAQRHTGEPELRLEHAKAAFNLGNDYGMAGDIPAARHLYDTLADLAQRHPGEPELRLRQAQAAFNLVSDYGTAGDIPAARHLYDTLADLAQRHTGEPELRLEHAEAAFNLVTLCGKAGDIPAARHFYDTLADLAQRHPGESELRLEHAKAAFNLLNDYRTAGDIPAARHLYDTLAALAHRHPGEEQLLEPVVRGLRLLFRLYREAGDDEAGRSLFASALEIPSLKDALAAMLRSAEEPGEADDNDGS